MSKSGFDICEDLIAALKADTELSTYCSDKFNKEPKFYLGVDELEPPETEEAPFIVLMSMGYKDEDSIAKLHNIFLGCVISDNAMENETRVTKFIGLATIEEFESIVLSAIDTYLNESTVNLSMLDEGDFRAKPFFPEFHSARQIKILSER